MQLGFDDINMRLGKTLVLEHFNLRIAPGESVALLGTSGSGKTTALRIAAGFLKPDRGRVSLGRHDITDWPPERRRMALIHQQFLLFPHLTVAENIVFGMAYHGVAPDARDGRVASLLARLGLDGLERRYPHELSGGQQQRVAIARALAVAPSVLLLDEPLNNLDSSNRELLLQELRSLQREAGMSMLYVTHDWAEALRIADRLALLDRGRILQTGPFEEVLARPASLEVARLFGARNIFRGETEGAVLHIPELDLHLDRAVPIPGPVCIYLPSDALRLGPTSDGRLGMKGQVEAIIPDTLVSRLRIRSGNGILELVATRPDLLEAGAQVGSVVNYSFDMKDVHVLPEAP